MLLLGLGLRTLSLTPSRIPDIRRVVRSVRMADCEQVARRVLRLESDRQVLRCLQEELGRAAPDFRAGEAADPAVIGTVLDFFQSIKPRSKTPTSGHDKRRTPAS